MVQMKFPYIKNTSVKPNYIINRLKDKLIRYYELGIGDEELIILFPTNLFNELVSYVEFENKDCNYLESKDVKSYIWGIEVKRVNDLDDIYVSFK